jgi:hypothetical protein
LLSRSRLILAYVGRFSLVTLATNFFILPAQPAVMIYDGAATLPGLAFRPSGGSLECS